jgi:hypothetical protein
MKNTQTLGLLIGTTCLATIAMTQASRPGDAPAQERQPPVAGQQNADSLMMVQKRLQQAVTSEVRAGAMKHDVKIDESAVMISLIGDGIVAGAPASSSGLDSQRKPGEPTSTTGTPRDQSQPGQSQPGTTTTTATQNVMGVVLLSRSLAPAGGTGQPGATGRTPGAAGGEPGADGAQNPQDRAGQGTTAQGAAGSNELVAFEVRRSQLGQNIELVDQSGQVALQVQLLGAAHAAGRTREASAPREDREDATVGGGDPLGDPRAQDPKAKDPQGKDRAGNPALSGMDAAGSADWSVVYASVVNQLCSKHHGKK